MMLTENHKKLAILIPIVLLVVYFFAGILYQPKYVIYIKPLIIPAFLFYAIVNNKNKLTKNYFLFAIFFYAHEVLILFWQDSVSLFQIALIASFFSYLALLILGYNAIKDKQIYSLPKGISLLVLFLNGLFLLAILHLLIGSVGDLYLNIIMVFNAIVAVFLGVTAILYLSNYTGKKAYFYFFGSFALILNDVFGAIVSFFIESVFLNSLDRILHFMAFYLIYLFVIQEKNQQKLD